MNVPDLSLVQITFLAGLARLQDGDAPVMASDLRALIRPSFEVAQGATFYQVMGRLVRRGLVDKTETTTPGTENLPASLYVLTVGGLEALDEFKAWHAEIGRFQ